jgi:hypothetical protein
MQQIERALQDTEAFHAWLVTKRDHKDPIGSRSLGWWNPLALWLSDLYGKMYHVSSTGYRLDGSNDERPHVWWMQAFIERVLAGSDTFDLAASEDTAVDPTDALSVLDAVAASLDDLDAHPF